MVQVGRGHTLSHFIKGEGKMIFLIFFLFISVVMFLVSIDLRHAYELAVSRFCLLISIYSFCLFILFFIGWLYE